MKPQLGRRQVIRGLGMVGAAVVMIPRLAGRTARAQTVTPACVLTPEQTEGPYYLDLSLLRSDIAEGRPGAPLQLVLMVVAADGCAAIANAVVEVWHADALGSYSGYASEGTAGETFCRGSQVTDADGLVEFLTVYPGWYTSRTTHIHVKVHVGSTTAVTSQLYFPDEITDGVYAASPYNTRGQRDTTNETDSIFADGNGSAVLLDVTSQGGVYVAELTLGIDAASSTTPTPTPLGTATPTATATAGCGIDSSFATALCQTAELRDLVTAALSDGTLRQRLLRPLDRRVAPRISQAETLAGTGRRALARSALGNAIAGLRLFQRRLNDRVGRAGADEATRTALSEAAQQLIELLQSLRQTLA